MRKTTIITTSRPVARARVSETVVWERKPAVEYVRGPRSSLPPLIRTVTPPKALPAPSAAASAPEEATPPETSTPPPEAPPAVPEAPAAPTPLPPTTKVEIVSVVESSEGSSKGSRASVTSKSGRRSREEVYIERERETIRMDPVPKPSKDLDVFRYMIPPEAVKRASLESGRRRSINYGPKPRTATRMVEREKRLIIEDGGRRREYYQ